MPVSFIYHSVTKNKGWLDLVSEGDYLYTLLDTFGLKYKGERESKKREHCPCRTPFLACARTEVTC